MKYAILSNIHGNYSALETAVNDISKFNVEKIICLGGIVGYGPKPIECIELLEKKNAACIKGIYEILATNKGKNDYYAAHYFGQTMEWTRKTLKSWHLDYLINLPTSINIHNAVFSNRIHLQEYSSNYLDDLSDAKTAFNTFEKKFTFFASDKRSTITVKNNKNDIFWSYHPYCNAIEHNQVIMGVGSTGKPRDRNPNPTYAIFDSIEESVTIERFEYDIRRTQREMLQFKFPEFLIQTLAQGR